MSFKVKALGFRARVWEYKSSQHHDKLCRPLRSNLAVPGYLHWFRGQ